MAGLECSPAEVEYIDIIDFGSFVIAYARMALTRFRRSNRPSGLYSPQCPPGSACLVVLARIPAASTGVVQQARDRMPLTFFQA